MIATAGSYLALVSLWPADSRPYIGGSTDNSLLQLALGYNGIQRIAGGDGGPGGGGPEAVTDPVARATCSSAATPASAGCSVSRWVPRRPGCCPPR